MNSKETFFACLRDEWTPLLRRLGFKESGQRFQRDLGQVIHVIGVQVNRYGGSCCVNLGLHLLYTFETYGEPRFQTVTTVAQVAETIQVEDIERGWPISSLYSFTSGRAGLTMARIYEYLGNREQAHVFARAGLSHVGQAKAVRTALEEFLNRV